ncbi:MAG: hypothetical protein GC162_20840 [Planctomycetes bacterium]|nr:hypothetical protein [Planctomycetota bacterium]
MHASRCPAPLSDEHESASVKDEINEAVAEFLPWLTSVTFHLGVIVLAIFLVIFTQADRDERDGDMSNVIPTSSMYKTQSSLNTTDAPVLTPRATDLRTVKSEAVQPADPTNLNATKGKWEDLIGVQGGSSAKAIGGVVTDGGAIGYLDAPAGAVPPSVVYVIDASGSLLGDMKFVTDELKRSIDRLGADQKFTVIFFQRDIAIELPPRGLKSATDAAKMSAKRWVSADDGNIVPGGNSNPLPALRVGLGYRPAAMFVLSDNITGRGRYEVDRGELLAELNKLDPQHRTRIHTIQFLYPDPLNTLHEIADGHGGTFRMVRESELLGPHSGGSP